MVRWLGHQIAQRLQTGPVSSEKNWNRPFTLGTISYQGFFLHHTHFYGIWKIQQCVWVIQDLEEVIQTLCLMFWDIRLFHIKVSCSAKGWKRSSRVSNTRKTALVIGISAHTLPDILLELFFVWTEYTLHSLMMAEQEDITLRWLQSCYPVPSVPLSLTWHCMCACVYTCLRLMVHDWNLPYPGVLSVPLEVVGLWSPQILRWCIPTFLYWQPIQFSVWFINISPCLKIRNIRS
jgi:hypothetical protein